MKIRGCKGSKKLVIAVVALVMVGFMHGCRQQQSRTAPTYKGVGLVESIDLDLRMVQIYHEEIKDFMPAMSMPFVVEKRSLLSSIHPGEKVEILIEDGELGMVITDIKKIGGGESAKQSGQTPDVAKALGALYQVIDNLKRYITNKDLSYVHSEDARLFSALAILRSETHLAKDGKKAELEAALPELGRLFAELHAASDAFDQAGAENQLQAVTGAFETTAAFYDDSLLASARVLTEQFCCPMHPDVVGKTTDSCPKCGMILDQQARVSLFGFKGGLVHTAIATIETDAPLVVGTQANCKLRLTTVLEEPVVLDDLHEVHTEKIHLLVIDPSLTDYHHEHPRPTGTPGEYTFSFTPRKPGPYRAWADIRPRSTGFQEYDMTDILSSGVGEPLVDKSVKLKAEVDGNRYELEFDDENIKADQPTSAKLRITKINGAPFKQLEPLMGAFAHLVGFSEDYRTVIHLHPQESKLLVQGDRGGPELEFQFFAAKPGFIRFFAQVQIGGESKFVPFGLNVTE